MPKIVPVTLPIFGTVDEIHVTVLPFDLFQSSINIYYRLNGERTLEGNLNLPAEVVASWGTDDQVVLDYITSQLGVELAPEEEPEAPAE